MSGLPRILNYEGKSRRHKKHVRMTGYLRFAPGYLAPRGLSADFLQLIRLHLNPGGVHFYNTTGSDEVMATGVRVFPYGMRLANFMVVSDTALQQDAQRWLNVLMQYRIDGKPVFDTSQEQDRRRLKEVLSLTATMDRALPTPFTLESADPE